MMSFTGLSDRIAFIEIRIAVGMTHFDVRFLYVVSCGGRYKSAFSTLFVPHETKLNISRRQKKIPISRWGTAGARLDDEGAQLGKCFL